MKYWIYSNKKIYVLNSNKNELNRRFIIQLSLTQSSIQKFASLHN